MSRRGENIRKRKDGRWEGRYKCGLNKDSKTKYISVYGHTYSEYDKQDGCFEVVSTIYPMVYKPTIVYK